MTESDAKLLNIQTLAFLGDSVFELYIREHLALKGSQPSGKLHAASVKYVCAAAQARLYNFLETSLNEEELRILKRGRNYSEGHPPRNAEVIDYRKATAVEALFGYFYLTKQANRLENLTEIMVSLADAAEISL